MYNNENSFNKFLIYSVSSHVSLLLIIIIAKVISGFIFGMNKMTLNLAQSSIRVDVVAMPTLSLKELRALESEINETKIEESKTEKVEKTIEEKNEETSKLEYLKEQEQKDKKEFLSLLKDLGKTKLNNKAEAPSKGKSKLALDNKMKQELQKLVIAGNKVSKGSSLTGETISDKEASEFNSYIVKLPDIIRPYWQLPSYLKDQDLKCRIRVHLSPDGAIIKTTIYESSGNEDYDLRALKSIQAAAPFPFVTPEIVDRVKTGDIVLGFPL